MKKLFMVETLEYDGHSWAKLVVAETKEEAESLGETENCYYCIAEEIVQVDGYKIKLDKN